MSPNHLKAKTLSRQAVLGELGINLIDRIVGQMKCRWNRSGPNEVGIDGWIEFFDPTSGAALSTIALVQSKAAEGEFLRETEGSFAYPCARRDLDYWKKQNAPVLLIVSRPEKEEAYWMSVGPGSDVARSPTATLYFDKLKNRFTPASYRELLGTASSGGAAISCEPVPKREKLISNLLEIAHLPDRIFAAQTELTRPGQVWEALKRGNVHAGGHWILRPPLLIGFHDFSDREWRDVCDVGSVESFPAHEWSQSTDADRIADFRQLLRRDLEKRLYPAVRFRRDLDCFYFRATKTTSASVPYASLARDSGLTVFKTYSKTSKGHVFTHHRHMAFQARFRDIDARHYLEITPTYIFTRDGEKLDRFHSERLAGIKRLEGNRAVVSQVVFWAEFLRRDPDLFQLDSSPIQYGKLATFELEFGVPDEEWLNREDPTAMTGRDSRTSEGTDNLEFHFET